jgi:hypothetical protein
MEVALYYPYIVPPLAWMKQSLLFFDSISTIVPIGYEGGADLPALTANDDNANALQWLEKEGHWIPVTSQFMGDERHFTYDLFRAINALVEAKAGHEDLSKVETSELIGSKLAERFQKRIVSSGLATVKGKYLEMPTYALYAIQSVIATHAIRLPGYAFPRDRLAITASTDSVEYFKFITEPMGGSFEVPGDSYWDSDSGLYRFYEEYFREDERSHCYQVLLDGLLPVPRPTVPLSTIIAFRESYRDDLFAFRIAVNEMLRDALESDAPTRKIMDHRAKIERALGQVHRAARSRKIQLGAAGITIATGIATTAFTGGLPAIKWVFDGIGAAISIAIASRAMRYPRREFDGADMTYLTRSYVLTESGKVPRRLT